MPVDVRTETLIDRPAPEVAAFAGDPTNATRWYTNIKRVEWVTPPPLTTGSRIRFGAAFLGRTLQYTYEVTAYEPGRALVMRTVDGPFPMETHYTWTPQEGDTTRMTLRNRGAPRGIARLLAPLLAAAMRRENRKDLARLKRILES